MVPLARKAHLKNCAPYGRFIAARAIARVLHAPRTRRRTQRHDNKHQREGTMFIQGFSTAITSYAATKSVTSAAVASASPSNAGNTASDTKLTLSDRAQALAGLTAEDVQARLDAIKAKPATQRSDEDGEFLRTHDERLAQLNAPGAKAWSADDLDYVQKAAGMVNTMSKLSPSEKQLYDDLVSQGKTDAAHGLALVALSRMGSGEVTLGNGQSFDPKTTEVTPGNIRQLFSQMFVDSDGSSGRAFDALASALDEKA
jgi:hypothetical protein